MATRETTPLAPRRVLATGFGALLVLYALTAAWIVVNSDTESASADTDRFVVQAVAVEVDDTTVSLTGSVPSTREADSVVDAVASRDDITVVINRLSIDPGVASPSLETIGTGLDVLRGVPE